MRLGLRIAAAIALVGVALPTAGLVAASRLARRTVENRVMAGQQATAATAAAALSGALTDRAGWVAATTSRAAILTAMMGNPTSDALDLTGYPAACRWAVLSAAGS